MFYIVMTETGFNVVVFCGGFLVLLPMPVHHRLYIPHGENVFLFDKYHQRYPNVLILF